MKQLSVAEKQRIIDSGKPLYLYNDIEEVAVKIIKRGPGDWAAFIKWASTGSEGEVNYKRSRISGDAFAYGYVLTEEEYSRFPEGFELSELTKMIQKKLQIKNC